MYDITVPESSGELFLQLKLLVAREWNAALARLSCLLRSYKNAELTH